MRNTAKPSPFFHQNQCKKKVQWYAALHCHDGGPSSSCTASLDIASAALGQCNITFHLPPEQEEQILTNGIINKEFIPFRQRVNAEF